MFIFTLLIIVLKLRSILFGNYYYFRDIAYDSHAYRRDNWKIIVGNALDPFPFHQVYEEPTDVSFKKMVYSTMCRSLLIIVINDYFAHVYSSCFSGWYQTVDGFKTLTRLS